MRWSVFSELAERWEFGWFVVFVHMIDGREVGVLSNIEELNESKHSLKQSIKL
jgi:hypothetical protein